MKTILTFVLTILSVGVSYANEEAQQLIDQSVRLQQQKYDQQQRDERASKPITGLDVLVDMPSVSFGKERCYPITTIAMVNVDGHPLELRWFKYTRFASTFENSCFDLQSINELITAITAKFIEDGWITVRLGLPEQDLSSGILSIVTIVGVRGDVITEGVEPGLWKLPLPTLRNQPINLREIEQAVDQIQRLQSKKAHVEVVPGQQIGVSDLAVDISKGKNVVQGSLSQDNHGIDATGVNQISASLVVDNPFGLADQWIWNVLQSGDKPSFATNQSMSLSVPFGFSTLTARSGNSESERLVVGAYESFILRSKSDSWSASLSRVLYRDADSKFIVDIERGRRASHSYIDDTEIHVQFRDQAHQKVTVTWQQRTDNGRWELGFSTTTGRPDLGGQDDAPDLRANEGTRRFNVDRYTLSRTAEYKTARQKTFTVENNFNLQQSSHVLLGTEMASIGSAYTVRGFDGGNALTAESAWYLQTKLGMPWGFGNEAQTWAAIDIGRVGGPSSNNLSGRELVGFSVGQNANFGEFSYDLSIAIPVSAPIHVQSQKPVFRASIKASF